MTHLLYYSSQCTVIFVREQTSDNSELQSLLSANINFIIYDLQVFELKSLLFERSEEDESTI